MEIVIKDDLHGIILIGKNIFIPNENDTVVIKGIEYLVLFRWIDYDKNIVWIHTDLS